MEPWQVGLMLIAGLGIGYSLIQKSKTFKQRERQDSLTDALEDVKAVESSARGIVQQLEVRAYNYSREVEARIDNRLAVLDQLIVDADREIERLQTMLIESRQAADIERELTPKEQQRCFALHEAGLTIEEIARCINASVASVDRALNEWRGPSQRAA